MSVSKRYFKLILIIIYRLLHALINGIIKLKTCSTDFVDWCCLFYVVFNISTYIFKILRHFHSTVHTDGCVAVVDVAVL